MKKIALIVLAILVSSFFLPPRVDYFVFAEGAMLNLSPETGSFSVSKTFVLRVTVASGGQPINAAEGVLSFDKSYLSVSKVSKEDSIFTLWAVEPSFSNANGTVTFGGGNTSSFNGNSGTVVSVTFKALKPGSTEVTFSSGSILAADGKGTNVIAGMGKGTYTLKEAVVATPTPAPTPLPAPPTPTPMPIAAPEISSTTHPEPEQWYANNDPEFGWRLPPDVIGVSIALTQEADSDPGPVFPSLIESQSFKDVPDGEWFVHIKYQDKNGTTATTHRKVRVDVTAPKSFSIDVQRDDATDPRPRLYMSSSDAISGLKHYEIVVGEGEAVKMTIEDFRREVREAGMDEAKIPYPYIMPFQAAGTHPVHVKAVDRAGNVAEVNKDIVVEAIEVPRITQFAGILRAGTVLLLEGSTLPDSTVMIRLQKGEEKAIVEEVKNGGKIHWQFVKRDIEEGMYKAQAKTIDKRGSESAFSEMIEFRVVPPALIEKYGWIAIGVLALGIIALYFILRSRKKEVARKKELILKEIKVMREHMKDVFDALDEDVEEKVKYLTENPGYNESDHVLEVLRADIETSQELIGKEMQDVEKAVQ